MQGFNVAPMCGYLAGPQDLGTIQDRTKGLKAVEVKLKNPTGRKNTDGLKYIYTKKNADGFSEIVGQQNKTIGGTSITIGKTTCFSPEAKKGKITICTTEIQGGAKLVQDETGTRVQQSEYQRLFSKNAVLVNAVSESEVFTLASK